MENSNLLLDTIKDYCIRKFKQGCKVTIKEDSVYSIADIKITIVSGLQSISLEINNSPLNIVKFIPINIGVEICNLLNDFNLAQENTELIDAIKSLD